MNKIPDDELVRIKCVDVINKLIAPLKYFVFEKGLGGYGNLPDELTTAILYSSYSELQEIFKMLNLGFNVPAGNSRNDPHIITTKDSIGEYKWIIVVTNTAITIKPFNGDPYYVCPKDFKACLWLERKIEFHKFDSKVPIELLQSRPRSLLPSGKR